MIKLREIIQHLDANVYANVETALQKTKAENFLCLLRSYRNDRPDAEIMDTLELSSNSFYVLKSRLFDKIQDTLSGDVLASREELLKKLNDIQEICLTEPREVAVAYLHKLEKDLLRYDMHAELLIVYSAIKKLFLYSDKYFHYSQLFNKHIAFSLSLEKSEEILGNFNRVLGQYHFSRSEKLLETLLFLRREISDHFALNPSRQIEIIRSVIELQLLVLCRTALNEELNTEKVLSHAERLITELPDTSPHKSWLPVLHFLRFEYYLRMGQLKSAAEIHEILKTTENNLLLYSHIACTGHYYLSKISFAQRTGSMGSLPPSSLDDVLFDADDMFSVVQLSISKAVLHYHSGNIREAVQLLNGLLNEYSFKDYFHISADIRLTLAWLYIQQTDYDLADSLLKGVYRKIKGDKIDGYQHVLDLIRLLELQFKQNGTASQKQKDLYMLFAARNKNEKEILRHLTPELDKKYN